ncbi:DUF2610 domain-containing protein [Candidatus Trichorickettsia mobilis]|jgi:hypothetical protein|uniref:DUF2610 domain-containing protein n=1 Tax=Candidatus Trichorickettsia mobilis TaxID=1346319 RepID=A0ABZ0USY3_9RICK|nr:DUF2610 domain-containing protein [Candidatus Trichorickettsia mobilis]WPY01145.1 DUF2610 domain-containing protein [Candidatus Trichorickettsia mobilis]
MKKFTINCDFGGQLSPFSIYIGQPEAAHHPLHFQADWLSKQRGGSVPADVMDAISKLQELANKNNVSLEELCVYALGTATDDKSPSQEGDTNSNNDNGVSNTNNSDQEESKNN